MTAERVYVASIANDPAQVSEAAYGAAIAALAMGLDYSEARDAVRHALPGFAPEVYGRALSEAYRDRVALGIDPDDIGEGW